MSDGDYDAALGYRRTSGGDRNGVSASLQPTRRSAPWERFCEPERDDAIHRWQVEPSVIEAAEPVVPPVEPQAGDNEAVGCHAEGGVSVADLIAKIGAPAADRPSHHHHPHQASGPVIEPDIPIALQDTQVIDTPAY